MFSGGIIRDQWHEMGSEFFSDVALVYEILQLKLCQKCATKTWRLIRHINFLMNLKGSNGNINDTKNDIRQ